MEKLEFDLKTELISDAVINFAVGFAGIQDDDRKEQIVSIRFTEHSYQLDQSMEF